MGSSGCEEAVVVVVVGGVHPFLVVARFRVRKVDDLKMCRSSGQSQLPIEKGAHLGQHLARLGKIASLPSDSCSTTNRLFSHPSMHALLRWHTQDSTFATGLFVYNIPPNSDRIILRQLLM